MNLIVELLNPGNTDTIEVQKFCKENVASLAV